MKKAATKKNNNNNNNQELVTSIKIYDNVQVVSFINLL
jgi:hypothetical protein